MKALLHKALKGVYNYIIIIILIKKHFLEKFRIFDCLLSSKIQLNLEKKAYKKATAERQKSGIFKTIFKY